MEHIINWFMKRAARRTEDLASALLAMDELAEIDSLEELYRLD